MRRGYFFENIVSGMTCDNIREFLIWREDKFNSNN